MMEGNVESDQPRKRARLHRPRGRPPRQTPKPNLRGLPALPAEVIGRIASFLIPQHATPEAGFAPPTDLPYGGKHGITQQDKLSAYGGIPSGVRDVLRLSQTCRQCDRGVSLVVGKIGNAATKDKKRTLYITLPHDVSGWVSLAGREDVNNSPSFHLIDKIKASSATLEHLVVSGCPHKPKDGIDPHNSALHNVQPFQKNDTTFPALKHLQLGPNLCPSCTRSTLRLFCAKEFYERKEIPAGGDESSPNFIYLHNAVPPHPAYRRMRQNRERIEQFDETATPNLTSLLVHLPTGDRHSLANDNGSLEAVLREIGQPDKIQMLQVWTGDVLAWGGLGANGTVDKIALKSRKTVEAEMTSWAEAELDKGKTAHDRLLAKFQAQAKLALPKPTKKTDTTAAGTSGTAGDGTSGPDSPVKQSIDTPGSLNDATTPMSRDISHDSTTTDGAEDDDDDQNNSSAEQATSTTTATAAVRRHRRSNQAPQQRTLAECEYRQMLRCIVQKLPNLVGLSLLRDGLTRFDVTETKADLSETVEALAEPLKELKHLRYLDLGLAIVGRAEVADFPLGLSVGCSRHGKAKGREYESDLQALKRRHYTLATTKAKKEGDEWRKIVLERLVNTSTNLVSLNQAESENSNQPGGSDTDAVNGGNDDTFTPKWPKGIRSGHIFAPDLTNRLRRNGVVIPWRVEGGAIVLEQPIGVRL